MPEQSKQEQFKTLIATLRDEATQLARLGDNLGDIAVSELKADLDRLRAGMNGVIDTRDEVSALLRASGHERMPIWDQFLSTYQDFRNVGFDVIEDPAGCLAPENNMLPECAGALIASVDALQTWADQHYTPYIFLFSVNSRGRPGSVDDASSVWVVSTSTPRPGSLIERDHADPASFAEGASRIEEAVQEFFRRMRDTGFPGVLDTADLRAWHATPLDFTQRLTEELADECDDIDEDDQRLDDFDNGKFAPLREAMVDACPEFTGEEPDAGVGEP